MTPLLRVLLLVSLLWPYAVATEKGEDFQETDLLYADRKSSFPVMDFVPAVGRFPPRGDFRRSMKAKMVEFYNPYCGACQAYRPTYLKLARALKEEVGDHLEVYAVSCQVHKEVCNDYGVDEIPLVVLFKKGDATPNNQRKLQVPEKNPTFIVKHLFEGDNNEAEAEGRALEEGDDATPIDVVDHKAGGSADNNDNSNESKNDNNEEEDDDDDNNKSGEEENENNSGEENENENQEDGKEEDGETEDGESGDGDGQENEDTEEVAEADGGDGEVQEDADGGNEEEENGDDEYDRKGQGNAVEGEEIDQAQDGEEEPPQDEYEEEGENEQQFADGMKVGQEEEEEENETQLDRDAAEANREWFANQFGGMDPQNNRLQGGSRGIKHAREAAEGAGARMKAAHPSDMDRFRDAMSKRQSNKIHNFFRRESLGAPAKRLKEEKMDTRTGATHAMKAHTPGTPEFNMRQEKMQAHMDKLMRQKSLRTTAPGLRTFSAGAGGAARIPLPKNHKPVMPYKKEVRKPKLVHDLAGKVPIVRRMVKLSHEEALILDASLSFTAALKQGLHSGTVDPLSKGKKRAFQTWLDLLRISLPPEWGIHELIMDLDNNIDHVSQSDKNLQRFLKIHELPRHEWSRSCTKNGRHKENGFNCGFWKLLHVISVGLAEHRGGLNLIEANLVSHEVRVFSPQEAADAIREFIANFFICTECKNHFVADFDECKYRRCVRLTEETDDASSADWQELSKWLWEMHNGVNVRLFNDRHKQKGVSTSVHDEVAALYPSLEECVTCFEDDGGYDEEGVFLFLEKEYWPGASDIDPAADKLLTFHNVEYAGFASSWAILFLGMGIIYALRPKGVIKGKKVRAE